MEYIKDKTGDIVLAVDEKNLYYLSEDPEEYSELDENEVKQLFLDGETASIEIVYLKDDSGYKLLTLLKLQEEMGLVDEKEYVFEQLQKINPFWNQVITSYFECLNSLSKRIILMELDGNGPTSSWNDILSLFSDGESFDLYSYRDGSLSASEIIEYYGFEDSEFWDFSLANGEFIEGQKNDLKSANELYDGIVTLLGNCEQWDIPECDIDWNTIIDVLLQDEKTLKIGLELKLLLASKN